MDDVLDAYDRLVGAVPAALPQNRRPEPHPNQPVPAAMLAYFAGLGISEDTVRAFGVYALVREGKAAMAFPWLVAGDLLNRSYRVDGRWSGEIDMEASLFGWDSLTDNDGVVVVASDEIEAMAFHEAGVTQVVATPRRRIGEALERHAVALDGFTKFIVTHADEATREELGRRLGKHRAWLPLWPRDCTDGVATLVKHGPDALRRAVSLAEPFPIDGVQTIRPGMLATLRKQPPAPTMTTGCANTDDIMRFPADGRLIVVTGIPGHGKSTWLTFAAVHTMKVHSRKWALYSPEMSPWGEYVAHAAQVLTGKAFRYNRRFPDQEVMSDADLEAAEEFLRSRMVLFEHDSEEKPPTLDWFLGLARLEVLRRGVTDVAIDPWTEIDTSDGEGGRGDTSNVRQLQNGLQKLTAFAKRHGVNVWVVAHPTKLAPAKPGGKIEPPGFYDIAGGAQWYNKATLGVTVHAEDGIAKIYTRKVRFARLGKRNAVANLILNQATGIYSNSEVSRTKKGAEDVE